jgi:hypothetical protein
MEQYSMLLPTMPVLALGAGYYKYLGNVTMPLVINGMPQVAENVTGVKVHKFKTLDSRGTTKISR